MSDVAQQWSQLESAPEKVFTFFDNWHRGQAAANAEAFRRIVTEMGTEVI